jgi:DNA-binding LytR/AlgR family response regulator
MTTALIADDEPHLVRYLADQLKRLWPELELVATARNGVEAAAQIDQLQPDLAFLDIKMPGLTGLEVAQGIEGTTRVVFVTAYDEFAVQAFEAEALDYVLKPVQADRLQRTIDRIRKALGEDAAAAPGGAQTLAPDDARLAAALRRLMGGAPGSASALAAAGSAAGALPPLRWIRASAGELTTQIPVEDVLFFRADEKYTCVQTATREHLIRTPIAELAAQLDPQLFTQVHRSTLINLKHLAGTRRDEASRLWLRMTGHATELPVSRAYVHLFKAM